MKRLGKRRQDEETTYWLSYSDMMAGLLLTFVLIISLTVLHSKIQYDEKQIQLVGKEQELIVQSEELEQEKLRIEKQGAKLNAQEQKLTEQEGELLDLQKQIEDQEDKLLEQSELVQQLKDLMDEQQDKLDKIIGIRSELIEALKKEFDNSSLNIAVDEKTGAITMDSNILFEYNKADLKSTGKDFLKEFMSRYLKILMSTKYSPYVSEIVIEGHTDTSGQYLFNLELSQKRAYSVAEYCLDKSSGILTDKEAEELQKVLATNGKSWSNPILNDDNTVNADASRRVEILFRLRDEEMIREMMEILNEGSVEKNSSGNKKIKRMGE